MVAIRNQSGVDLTFKSGFDRSGWQYEEEVVNDLFAVKNQAGEVYNESALAGVNVSVCDRIINNVWDEEFASVSNGLEFKIKPATEGQSWKTSGNAKIYEACEEGTEGAVKGTDGKWYKPTSQAWTSEGENGWNKTPGFSRLLPRRRGKDLRLGDAYAARREKRSCIPLSSQRRLGDGTASNQAHARRSARRASVQPLFGRGGVRGGS